LLDADGRDNIRGWFNGGCYLHKSSWKSCSPAEVIVQSTSLFYFAIYLILSVHMYIACKLNT